MTAFIVVKWTLVFLGLRVVTNCTASSTGEENGVAELLSSMLSKYHKDIVPSKPVTIWLNILLLKVKNTVAREGIFESVIAMFLEWVDQRVTWNPSKYQNVSEIPFNSEEVWLPDIAIINSAENVYSISKDTNFVIRVTHQGIFNFVPTGTSRTWCDFDLKTFPFDIQTCSLMFESWSLNSSSLIFNKNSTIIIDPSFSSPQFSLCGVSANVYDYFYALTNENFSRVEFAFSVRRKSSFYVVNLIFPIATLSLIQPLVFFIPVTDSATDRVGFGTTNMLTLVVFQTIVTDEMPKSSDGITALSGYIIFLIILSAIGIYESVLTERLNRTSSRPPPQWLLKLTKKLCPFKFKNHANFYIWNEMNKLRHSQRRSSMPINWQRSSQSMDMSGRRVIKPNFTENYRKSKISPTKADSEANINKTNNKVNNQPLTQQFCVGTTSYCIAALENIQEWETVSFGMDMILFCLFTSLSILFPICLFFPLTIFADDCNINN